MSIDAVSSSDATETSNVSFGEDFEREISTWFATMLKVDAGTRIYFDGNLIRSGGEREISRTIVTIIQPFNLEGNESTWWCSLPQFASEIVEEVRKTVQNAPSFKYTFKVSVCDSDDEILMDKTWYFKREISYSKNKV